jgi:hypothetical protein
MRVVVAVPHFFRPKPDSPFRSELSHPRQRANALLRTLAAIHQNIGSRQALIGSRQVSSNTGERHEVRILVVTTGGNHLLHLLPSGVEAEHVAVDCDPRRLGYECHRLLRDRLNDFDYFGYMEDDLHIGDGYFIDKTAWFTQVFGQGCILLPNRYEEGFKPPYKLYIDGQLAPRAVATRDQYRTAAPRKLVHHFLGGQVGFETADNPHAGCFFLSGQQLAAWAEKPFFLDYSDAFWGPLESAATLGILRTFEVFKPARTNAAFLEVGHLDPRHLRGRSGPAPGATSAP